MENVKEANEGLGCAAIILALAVVFFIVFGVPRLFDYLERRPQPCVENTKGVSQ